MPDILNKLQVVVLSCYNDSCILFYKLCSLGQINPSLYKVNCLFVDIYSQILGYNLK